jgi:hypothetical protein
MAPGTVPVAHNVAFDPAIARSGIPAIRLRSCSVTADLAVLTYNTLDRPVEFWVVRISDGKILLHQADPANTLADVTASPDASLIAKSASASSGYVGGPSALETLIFRTSDKIVVRALDPGIGVLAFSSDNRFVLLNTTPYAPGVLTHAAAMELATGKVVWRYDGNEQLSGFFVAPTGAAFGVMLQDPSDSGAHPAVNVVIANTQGPSHELPGRFVRP